MESIKFLEDYIKSSKNTGIKIFEEVYEHLSLNKTNMLGLNNFVHKFTDRKINLSSNNILKQNGQYENFALHNFRKKFPMLSKIDGKCIIDIINENHGNHMSLKRLTTPINEKLAKEGSTRVSTSTVNMTVKRLKLKY